MAKAIYSRINFWIVSKAMNVVNSYLAMRASYIGYTPVSGWKDDHPAVIDWKNFEDMMCDIEYEYSDEQKRIERYKERPYIPAYEDTISWKVWWYMLLLLAIFYYLGKALNG